MCMHRLGQKYMVNMNNKYRRFTMLHKLPSGADFGSRMISFWSISMSLVLLEPVSQADLKYTREPISLA